MNWISALLLCCLFVACKDSSPGPAPKMDANGYEITEVNPGIAWAVKKDAGGMILEEGQLVNGVKQGTWVTYKMEGGYHRIRNLSNYAEGKKTGISIDLNERGMVVKESHYLVDKLHGLQTAYFSGNWKMEEINYKNGLLDGRYTRYYKNVDNTIQHESFFKEGKQDGMFRAYDDRGNVTMEYVYRNGKKVEGTLR